MFFADTVFVGHMTEITLTPVYVPGVALPREQIVARVQGVARLPSLRSIDNALRDLLNADQRYTTQISEVIRRDPSLTSRLLRLVNSVYFSLTTPVNNIEEAVFYLGVKQIRQLAMVTPIIEDFEKLAGNTPFTWRKFWQHCIATAILTREVTNLTGEPGDESDYLAGLIHDVGKIVMASSFREQFAQIDRTLKREGGDRLALERQVLGIDHCELGAIYLEHNNLPPVMVETARHHHNPRRAENFRNIVAAVQISDLLVRHAKIGDSGNPEEVGEDAWLEADGWSVLFPAGRGETERSIARAALSRAVERLPTILEGLV